MTLCDWLMNWFDRLIDWVDLIDLIWSIELIRLVDLSYRTNNELIYRLTGLADCLIELMGLLDVLVGWFDGMIGLMAWSIGLSDWLIWLIEWFCCMIGSFGLLNCWLIDSLNSELFWVVDCSVHWILLLFKW